MSSTLRALRRTSSAGAAVLAILGRARLRRLHREPWKARAAAISEGCRAICQLHGFRTVVTGEVPTGAAVLVANHLSYLDPILIAPAVDCLAIAKGEVAGWPLLGTAMEAVGVLFVDRSDVHDKARVLRRAMRALESGASLLNFPEGTTTDGSRLLPFHRGVFGAARITGVPIVPVALSYEASALHWTGNQTFLPHYWRTAGRAETTARLHFCPPLAVTAGDRAEDLAERARRVLLDTLQIPGDLRHEAAKRLRVPAPRSDTGVPPAARRSRRAS